MDVMRVNALSVFLAVKHGARGMLVTGSEKQYPGGSIVGTGEWLHGPFLALFC